MEERQHTTKPLQSRLWFRTKSKPSAAFKVTGDESCLAPRPGSSVPVGREGGRSFLPEGKLEQEPCLLANCIQVLFSAQTLPGKNISEPHLRPFQPTPTRFDSTRSSAPCSRSKRGVEREGVGSRHGFNFSIKHASLPQEGLHDDTRWLELPSSIRPRPKNPNRRSTRERERHLTNIRSITQPELTSNASALQREH